MNILEQLETQWQYILVYRDTLVIVVKLDILLQYIHTARHTVSVLEQLATQWVYARTAMDSMKATVEKHVG